MKRTTTMNAASANQKKKDLTEVQRRKMFLERFESKEKAHLHAKKEEVLQKEAERKRIEKEKHQRQIIAHRLKEQRSRAIKKSETQADTQLPGPAAYQICYEAIEPRPIAPKYVVEEKSNIHVLKNIKSTNLGPGEYEINSIPQGSSTAVAYKKPSEKTAQNSKCDETLQRDELIAREKLELKNSTLNEIASKLHSSNNNKRVSTEVTKQQENARKLNEANQAKLSDAWHVKEAKREEILAAIQENQKAIAMQISEGHQNLKGEAKQTTSNDNVTVLYPNYGMLSTVQRAPAFKFASKEFGEPVDNRFTQESKENNQQQPDSLDETNASATVSRTTEPFSKALGRTTSTKEASQALDNRYYDVDQTKLLMAKHIRNPIISKGERWNDSDDAWEWSPRDGETPLEIKDGLLHSRVQGNGFAAKIYHQKILAESIPKALPPTQEPPTTHVTNTKRSNFRDRFSDDSSSGDERDFIPSESNDGKPRKTVQTFRDRFIDNSSSEDDRDFVHSESYDAIHRKTANCSFRRKIDDRPDSSENDDIPHQPTTISNNHPIEIRRRNVGRFGDERDSELDESEARGPANYEVNWKSVDAHIPTIIMDPQGRRRMGSDEDDFGNGENHHFKFMSLKAQRQLGGKFSAIFRFKDDDSDDETMYRGTHSASYMPSTHKGVTFSKASTFSESDEFFDEINNARVQKSSIKSRSLNFSKAKRFASDPDENIDGAEDDRPNTSLCLKTKSLHFSKSKRFASDSDEDERTDVSLSRQTSNTNLKSTFTRSGRVQGPENFGESFQSEQDTRKFSSKPLNWPEHPKRYSHVGESDNENDERNYEVDKKTLSTENGKFSKASRFNGNEDAIHGEALYHETQATEIKNEHSLKSKGNFHSKISDDNLVYSEHQLDLNTAPNQPNYSSTHQFSRENRFKVVLKEMSLAIKHKASLNERGGTFSKSGRWEKHPDNLQMVLCMNIDENDQRKSTLSKSSRWKVPIQPDGYNQLLSSDSTSYGGFSFSNAPLGTEMQIRDETMLSLADDDKHILGGVMSKEKRWKLKEEDNREALNIEASYRAILPSAAAVKFGNAPRNSDLSSLETLRSFFQNSIDNSNREEKNSDPNYSSFPSTSTSLLSSKINMGNDNSSPSTMATNHPLNAPSTYRSPYLVANVASLLRARQQLPMNTISEYQ